MIVAEAWDRLPVRCASRTFRWQTSSLTRWQDRNGVPEVHSSGELSEEWLLNLTSCQRIVLSTNRFVSETCMNRFDIDIRYIELHRISRYAYHFFIALHWMQGGLVARKVSVRPSVCLSVCLSVCPSNACIVTKWKKNLSRFLYHAKDHLAWFSEKENGWWAATHST